VIASTIAARSARALFMNARRAGTLKKSCSTTTVVPLGCAVGETSVALPPSTKTLVPAPSPVAVVSVNSETLAMDGRASPRKPRVSTE
jgi:hypothetical protein